MCVQNKLMPVLEAKIYVEYRNSGYWIASTRISLDSIVYAFRRGLSPESIVQSFPLLTLELTKPSAPECVLPVAH